MTITEKCVHHWAIEPSHGASSKGVCQKCGEAKEFLNSDRTDNWLVSRPELADKFNRLRNV